MVVFALDELGRYRECFYRGRKKIGGYIDWKRLKTRPPNPGFLFHFLPS